MNFLSAATAAVLLTVASLDARADSFIGGSVTSSVEITNSTITHVAALDIGAKGVETAGSFNAGVKIANSRINGSVTSTVRIRNSTLTFVGVKDVNLGVEIK